MIPAWSRRSRSLPVHVTYGGVLLVSLVLALNVILHLLILRPAALMRQRLAGLERGLWRGPHRQHGG